MAGYSKHIRIYGVWGILVVVFVAAFFPISVLRVQDAPKEDEKYVRRIYDNHTVGQVFRHDYYSISKLAVLVRADAPHSATLIARNGEGKEVGRENIDLTTEDQWVEFTFKKSLKKGTDTIFFSTISGTRMRQSILMRYQIDSDLYSEGNMVVDGKDSYGDIAFQVTETSPAWRALLVWGQVNGTSAQRAALFLVEGAICAAAVFGLLQIRFRAHRQFRRYIPSVALFVCTVFMCAPYAHLLNGVFGGDAFNYMDKAFALIHGQDPFAADARKGPFFSLLLIPGLFLPDPLVWSRWVGIVAAGLVAGLVPLVARRMGIGWPVATMAGVFVAENSFLLFEAPDALAMTTFTFLILLCVYSFLSIKKNGKFLWVLAIASGLTMLTRFEGALVGAILLPAAWIRYRISWRNILWPIVVAILIMALPLSSYIISGKSGIRTAQDIQNDDGLFLVHSIHDKQLELNIQRSYEFFTNVFIEKGTNMNIALYLVAGVLIGILLVLTRRYMPRISSQVLGAIGICSAVVFLFALAMNNEVNKYMLVALLYMLTGIGIAFFVQKKPIEGIAILFAIASQVAVIIWILPKTRYFLPTIPFLYLFLAYGIYSLARSKKRIVQFVVLVILSTAGIYFYQDEQKYLEKDVEAYNNKAFETDVLVKALIDLRSSKQSVAVESLDDLAVRMYVAPEKLFYIQLNQTSDIAQQELQFIQGNHIHFLLKREDSDDWQIAQKNPELFSDPKIYTTKNGDAKVLVYTVK
ncbi:MAG: hypothetical protein K8Q97_03850 [Candidatus Andersenbacteria bacterium]|nr:hypothetical protein [Candidatus Andersenbacteria bacterium]